MACYHFNAGIISRGHGSSITAASAYISGEKLRDCYEGKIHDRSYRRDVLYKEILLPPNAPREFLDRQTWLDALNASERRSDAQMARTFKVALPREISFEKQLELVREFALDNFVNKAGLSADLAIHRGELDESQKPVSIEPIHERLDNLHAHLIVALRSVTEDGFSRTKLQTRWMNRQPALIAWRKDWAARQNREFERLGLDIRVSHESLAAQGINREPSIHMGAAAMALERQGIRTERGDQYREILSRNRSREQERQQRWERMLERTRDMERSR